MALVWITDFHLLFHAFVSWSFGTFSASFPFSPLQPAREAGTSRQYHQFLFLLQSWSWCGTIRQQLARSSHSGKGDKIPCFATKTYTEARIKGLTWCCSSTKSCNLGTMATQYIGLGLIRLGYTMAICLVLHPRIKSSLFSIVCQHVYLCRLFIFSFDLQPWISNYTFLRNEKRWKTCSPLQSKYCQGLIYFGVNILVQSKATHGPWWP